MKVMQNNHKQLCPQCKIAMRHHVPRSTRRNGSGRLIANKPVFTGILEEFHACPRCGVTAPGRKHQKS